MSPNATMAKQEDSKQGGDMDLRSMKDSIDLLDTTSVDDIAKALRLRLKVPGDDDYYRELAKAFMAVGIRNKSKDSPEASEGSNQENEPNLSQESGEETFSTPYSSPRVGSQSPSRLFRRSPRPWEDALNRTNYHRSSSHSSQPRTPGRRSKHEEGSKPPLASPMRTSSPYIAREKNVDTRSPLVDKPLGGRASPAPTTPIQTPRESIFSPFRTPSTTGTFFLGTPKPSLGESPEDTDEGPGDNTMSEKDDKGGTEEPWVPFGTTTTPFDQNPMPGDGVSTPPSFSVSAEETSTPLFQVDLSTNGKDKSKNRRTRKGRNFVKPPPLAKPCVHLPTSRPPQHDTDPSPKPEKPFEGEPKANDQSDLQPSPTDGEIEEIKVPLAEPLGSFRFGDSKNDAKPNDDDTGNVFPSVNAATMEFGGNNSASASSTEIQFTMGVGDKKDSPTKLRARRKGSASASRRRQFRINTNGGNDNNFPATGFPKFETTSQDADVVMEERSPEPQPLSSKEGSQIDFSGTSEMLSSLRDEARNHYLNGNYRLSVLVYSNALKVNAGRKSTQEPPDDLMAVLLANRAAGLLMLGAYEAAAFDCQVAIRHVAKYSLPAVRLSSESGPILKAKLFTRMGRAFLKLGLFDSSNKAFQSAIETATAVLERKDTLFTADEQCVRNLNQLSCEATLGKSEVRRCKENVDVLSSCGLKQISDAQTAARRVCLKALSCVNMALSLASGARPLHEMKVALLASLRRWRELLLHCERFAAETVKFDGVFVEDLLGRTPIPGVAPAKFLTENVFSGCSNPAQMAAVKLTSKAAAEAAVRLPPSIAPFYIRALRLEERYHNAMSSITALVALVRSKSDASERMEYSWLHKEKDKLERTTSAKERGDSLFRNGEYIEAAEKYSECLRIDAEGMHAEGLGGGRLHAVLHCNRAASFMALLKYRDAIADCTSALRIHAHYMKAMLRRGRCYVRLNRLEEAIGEYERYIELVCDARKSTDATAFQSTPCLFDGPKDVTDGDLEAVRHELREVKKSKTNAENMAKAEAAKRDRRQQFYNEAFGTGSRAHQAEAQARKEQWYNQQAGEGFRRWDSFGGRGPNRGSSNNTNGSANQSRWWSKSDYGRHRSGFGDSGEKADTEASSSSSLSSDHYKILNVSRNASEADIKKAYRQMALKFHPDKNQDAGAADMFHRVKQAYDVLGSETSRRNYDNETRWSRRY